MRAMADTLDDVEAGFMTHAEGAAAIRGLAEEIENRPSEIPTDPVDLMLYLAAAGITAFTAKTVVNRERDGARKKRNEPTG
jgi:hypothetical protein